MKLKKITPIAMAVSLLAGCASSPKLIVGGESMMEKDVVYTLTNLHPDAARSRLYSINYQQDGFIPRCSKVSLTAVNGNLLKFNYDGRNYHYIFHKASGHFESNIKKYFGTSCDTDVVSSLSEIDKKGIKNGKVYAGMSRKGVTLAIGYPPSHVTPSLEADVWRYWKNRFNTFTVNFNSKGLVEDIVD